MILTEPSVSRNHIEFVWTGTAWTAHDSSTHGSFDPIGVRLAPTWTVGTNTTIRLGGVEGVEVKIELVTTRPDPFGALGAPPAPDLASGRPGGPSGIDEVDVAVDAARGDQRVLGAADWAVLVIRLGRHVATLARRRQTLRRERYRASSCSGSVTTSQPADQQKDRPQHAPQQRGVEEHHLDDRGRAHDGDQAG